MASDVWSHIAQPTPFTLSRLSLSLYCADQEIADQQVFRVEDSINIVPASLLRFSLSGCFKFVAAGAAWVRVHFRARQVGWPGFRSLKVLSFLCLWVSWGLSAHAGGHTFPHPLFVFGLLSLLPFSLSGFYRFHYCILFSFFPFSALFKIF